MLKSTLLHPEILAALGRAGHGSRILIADGNYPFSTTLGRRATLVPLNLSPGVVNCTQVLQAIVSAVPLESAAVMQYAATGPYALSADPPIWDEFRNILASAIPETPPSELLEPIERFEFYRKSAGEDVALTIATGEQRIYANLLLRIGVVFPSDKFPSDKFPSDKFPSDKFPSDNERE